MDEPPSTGRESTVDWSALPDAVRGRLAELGAEAIGALPKVDVPQQLRAVARFTPAKRARLGGARSSRACVTRSPSAPRWSSGAASTGRPPWT